MLFALQSLDENIKTVSCMDYNVRDKAPRFEEPWKHVSSIIKDQLDADIICGLDNFLQIPFFAQVCSNLADQ